ncbi:MAG: hypothetical protein FJ086_05355, partial [Deltaproteobacteria bacterium]|nr:hypothetical protein [Deltaproteobacteria bacterium]
RAERTRAAAEAEEARSAPGRGGKRALDFIGFSQQASSSRVYVRTNGPATYDVSEAGSGRVVLTLEDTSIGMANNQRTLDTSFFETAVTRVQAVPGPGRSVRVEILLRRPVPYTAAQQGNEIRVDFERPGRP